MIKILVYGIDVGDRTPISHLHLGYLVRKYKDNLKALGIDVITVNILPSSDIRLEGGMTFQDILRKLPEGWEPDFVLIQGPEYVFLPRGLYESEYPLVFVTCDYDYDILRAYHFFKIADCVVCFSDESLNHIKKLGARKVVKFPIWLSFDMDDQNEDIIEIKKRKIDLFYSGNTNVKLMKDKAELFFHIAKFLSKNKLSYHINSGYLPKDEYIKKITNSKLSITYHRRKEIQRPEFILCGGILVTNSEEFSQIFIKDQDFFVYENFEDMPNAIERALDFINSGDYNHQERLERILGYRRFFHPVSRLYELLHFAYNNIDSSIVQERLGSANDYYILDILSYFQTIDIYALPKSVKEILLSTVRKIIEEKEGLFLFPENSPTVEIFNSYKTMVDFNISGRYSFKKSDNFVLPLNLALLEMSRMNYKSSIEFLNYVKEILSQEKIDSVFPKFIPVLSSIIPPQFFPHTYFPEYRDVFADLISSEHIDRRSREVILSYIDFVLACISRDMSLPNEIQVRSSLKDFDRAYEIYQNPKYLWEKAKALVKCGMFDKALEQFGNNFSIDYTDLFLPLCIINDCRKDGSFMYHILDLFFSTDQENDNEHKEKFLSRFDLQKNRVLQNPPKCGVVVNIGNDITSTSLFVQNIIWSIYPYVSFYAISSDLRIKDRIHKIFSEQYVKVFENIESLLNESADVFFVVPSSVILRQSKIFFDVVMLKHLEVSCVISRIKNKKIFSVALERELFSELVRKKQVHTDSFVFCPLSPGYTLFESKDVLSFSIKEDKVELRMD